MIAGEVLDTRHVFEGVPLKPEGKEKGEDKAEEDEGDCLVSAGFIKSNLGDYYEKVEKVAKTVAFLTLLAWIGIWLLLLDPFGGGNEKAASPPTAEVRVVSLQLAEPQPVRPVEELHVWVQKQMDDSYGRRESPVLPSLVGSPTVEVPTAKVRGVRSAAEKEREEALSVSPQPAAGIVEERWVQKQMDSYRTRESSVLPPQSQRLQEVIQGHLVFVNFMASWCRHSQQLNLVWDQLNREGFPDVTILRVDCPTHKALCDKHEIHSYPTIRLFHDGEAIEPRALGCRSLADLHSYLAKNTEMISEARNDLWRTSQQGVAEQRAYIHELATRLSGMGPLEEQKEEDIDMRVRDLVQESPAPKPSDDVASSFERLASQEEDGAQGGNREAWDLEIEYAVRARNLEKLLDSGENVIVSYTSSDSSTCVSFRPTWHEFAHRAQQSSNLNTLVVAEIDCAVEACPRLELYLEFPYYVWYHQGQKVGPSIRCNPQTMTIGTLLATSSMMLDMEKQHTMAD